MRLVTYAQGDSAGAGVLLGDGIVPVCGARRACALGARPAAALDAGGLAELGARARPTPRRGSRSRTCACCAPVPDPEKIVCLGLNYRDHAAEAGQEIPAAPMWFAKFANSLIGSGEPIVLPPAHAGATSTTRPSWRS